MPFEWVHFQFPIKIHIEKDSTHKMGSYIADFAKRVLLFTIKNEQRNEDDFYILKTSMERNGISCIVNDELTQRPSHDQIEYLAYFLKRSGVDLVVAYGGKFTFHIARTLCFLATNDYLVQIPDEEGLQRFYRYTNDLVNSKIEIKKDPLPLICIPSIFSMGEEASPDIFNYDEQKKTFFYHRDTRFFPQAILFDPNIIANMTKLELARASMAIIAASIESILSKRNNEIITATSLKAIDLVSRSIRTLMKNPENELARMNLAIANVVCGIAHSNTSLGLSYSIALSIHLLSGMDFYQAYAILLPHIMEYNLTTSARTYVQIAQALNEDIAQITIIEAAIKAIEGVRKLHLELGLSYKLSDFDLPKEILPEISHFASQFPLVHNTPRELDRNEIETILLAAY
ncbi:MAG: iron-containing alcohol dehydrogenase [Leptospiraceae bacterium]|nr:iron-containing alcohol dehydrogenase [Leptospiraceae bacterium]MDW7976897.1 iron-containing alcohol dehydrogenase [Leptospiraceae bacterium]